MTLKITYFFRFGGQTIKRVHEMVSTVDEPKSKRNRAVVEQPENDQEQYLSIQMDRKRNDRLRSNHNRYLQY